MKGAGVATTAASLCPVAGPKPMKFSALLALPLILTIGACSKQPEVISEAQAKQSASAATAEAPIVVELYQSQGCSSCPPANAAVNAVTNQPGIIALSFAVTYWDRLGWRDVFADKSYTQRQYDYAHALGNPNVYTPQIVINGKTALTGVKRGELATALGEAKPIAGGPSVDIMPDAIRIGAGMGSANIWLVSYDPRVQNVAIRSGENGGRILPHKNIVRSLVKLGEWSGASIRVKRPMADQKGLKNVVLVQRQGAGPIIAAKSF
jgi:hypothetical protein